mmetsp:Transcript_26089/g.38591  ORF Transcript_26089/g.38591 Transcript_26089/m.38591 type:complete len:685 (-) Transcript_26089:203-2257(-)
MSSQTDKQNENLETMEQDEEGSVHTDEEVVPSGSDAHVIGRGTSMKGTFSPGKDSINLDEAEDEITESVTSVKFATEPPKKSLQQGTKAVASRTKKVASSVASSATHVISSVASGASHVLPRRLKTSMSFRGSQSMTFDTWRRVRNSMLFSVVSIETVRNLDKVIFPTGKWIRRWDLFMLIILCFLLFYLPFQIGVSAGAEMHESIGWLVFHIILTLVFITDTTLYFFRPFQYPDGRLCLCLKTIRKHYIRGMFIFDFLSSIPWNSISYALSERGVSERSAILVFGILKLLRLIRLERLLVDSKIVTDIRMKYNSQWLQLIKYTIFIIVICHYIACIWCWVAFLENGNLNFEETQNWIHGWVNDNSPLEAYSPHPYGPDNAGDRYVISLFFAVQTITSIGYGNIAPQTVLEWWIGSLLQLIAGISWAYVIGGLIGVASGFNERNEEFGKRSDQANTLIRDFNVVNEVMNDDDSPHETTIEAKEVSDRIRNYIYQQYRTSSHTGYVHHLEEVYPTMSTLPPDLQKQAGVLLLRGNLDYVNYLSAYYMSYEEQGDIIMKCSLCEFPAGEIVDLQGRPDGTGRGIYLMQSGCAYYVVGSNARGGKQSRRLLTGGALVGAGSALLEDGHKDLEGSRLFFLTYSKVLFIPRDAINDALKKNLEAWKGSARWVYAKTVLGNSDIIQTYVM